MAFDDVFWVVLLVSLVIAMFASSLVLFVVQYKRSQQVHTMEKEHLEQVFQSQLLQTRLEVQEQSLRYFSEEIHDNIGQALTLVKLDLYEIKRSVNGEEAITIIDQGTELLAKAIRDLRNISHSLNGDFITNEGIEKMLVKELEHLNQSKTIKATLLYIGDIFSLGVENELLAFRIVQEAMNNAVKHSGTANIRVTLEYKSDMFTATITDDGKGFHPEKVTNSGLGLINMRSRAKLLKGRLEIFSEPNAGTTVQLQISSK